MVRKNDSHNDDVSYEEEGGEADSLKKIEKLKKELLSCKKEKDEYLNGWQRAKADFANLQKSHSEEKAHLLSYGKEAVLFDILPVLDSFSMAFKNKEAWENVDETWRVGVEHIHEQLQGALSAQGLTEFSDEGEKFDPEKHVPAEMVTVDSKEQDGIIVEVLQKGYCLQDKILRPARVKVGKIEQ